MIEHIQKYRVLILIALVAVAAGFVLGGSNLIRRSGGGVPVLKISGRVYNDREYQQLGSSSFELTSSLARSGDFALYQFLMGLSTGATSENDATEKFFIGRIVLREAKEEFGVFPGDEEISEYIRGMRAFAGQDGQFSQDNYRNFIEKGIGRLGLTEGDLRDLVSDVLAYQKINSIVGTGLGVNREVIARDLAFQNQQISGELARLEIGSFKEKIDPSEEDIKAYWEVIQDAFTTEPRRKFTYIIATPAAPEVAAEPEEAPETIADAAASDEAKQAAEKKKAEEKAKREAELAEARRKKQLEVDSLVDDFVYELSEQKGAGFEELARENEWEVKTTDFFTQANPPQELGVALRASSRGGKAVDELFRMEITSDPVSRISQPIAIGENQWLVARLDEVEPSRPKSYEEAKDEARAKYIEEKATEALKTAANEAAEKIKTTLAEGKSFAEAAKAADINETKSFSKITQTSRPDPATEPNNLFEATRYVDPGSLADLIIEPNRAFIALVSSREVVKEENAATRLDSEITSRARSNEMIAFISWLSNKVEAANVEQLYRK